MTFEDKIKAMLFERGMFEDDATAVVKMMKADELCELMTRRWQDNIENYPSSVLTLLWSAAEIIALRYIDANCPEAWFRSMFVVDSSG